MHSHYVYTNLLIITMESYFCSVETRAVGAWFFAKKVGSKALSRITTSLLHLTLVKCRYYLQIKLNVLYLIDNMKKKQFFFIFCFFAVHKIMKIVYTFVLIVSFLYNTTYTLQFTLI